MSAPFVTLDRKSLKRKREVDTEPLAQDHDPGLLELLGQQEPDTTETYTTRNDAVPGPTDGVAGADDGREASGPELEALAKLAGQPSGGEVDARLSMRHAARGVPLSMQINRYAPVPLNQRMGQSHDVPTTQLDKQPEDPELRALLNQSEPDLVQSGRAGREAIGGAVRWGGLDPVDSKSMMVAKAKGLSPAHGKAKALLAKMKPPTGDTPAPSMNPAPLGPDAPTQAAGGRSPLRQAVAQTAMGALPPPPTPPPEPDALANAQRAADESANKAGLIDQLNSATDLIGSGGTHGQGASHLSAMHAGDDVRAHGQQGVKDVLTQRDQARQDEDKSIQRAGEARAVGADQRAQTTFQAGREMDQPGTRQAKAYEAVAAGLYPDKVKGIPPEARAQMSANDWKAALGELQQQKPVATGGGAGGARGQAQLSKLLPPETANVYAATQRIKQLVDKAGGWDKVQGVGILGGLTPGFMMDDTGAELRQEIGNVAGIYLQSKGGKAITSHEEKIILDRIAANPKGATPDQLRKAVTIIERNVAANARQSLGGVPTAQGDQILDNSGVPHGWARQDVTTPTGSANRPQPQGGKVKVSNGKEHLLIDAADLADAQKDGFTVTQ